MTLTPLVAVHLSAALGALLIGPLALWARLGARARPRLHRFAGRAWVALMLVTALSAAFIRDFRLPNLHGYTPIHLLVPVTLATLAGAFFKLAHGDSAGHESLMRRLYIGACVVAGAFTLLPRRLLGEWLWVQVLGVFAPPVEGEPLQAASLAGSILLRTPAWVWGLLLALVVLGLAQTRRRQVGIARVATMPIAMTALSLSGTVSAFGATPAVLSSWSAAVAAGALVWLSAPLPGAVHYDATRRRIDLPGSWIPLLLIVAIFCLRYAVNVALSVRPDLVSEPFMAIGAPLAQGTLTGLFAGRAAALLRVAVRARAQRLSLQP